MLIYNGHKMAVKVVSAGGGGTGGVTQVGTATEMADILKNSTYEDVGKIYQYFGETTAEYENNAYYILRKDVGSNGCIFGKIGGSRGIVSIEKTATNGLVDTYTITYTDATTSTFEVTNGSGSDDIVTAAEELSAEYIVVGAGEKGVSKSNYKISDALSLTNNETTLPTSKQVYEAIEAVEDKVDNSANYVEKIKVNGYTLKPTNGLIDLGNLSGSTSSNGLPVDFITITPEDTDYWVLKTSTLYPDEFYWSIALPLSDAAYRVFNENNQEVLIPAIVEPQHDRVLYKVWNKGTYKFHKVSSQELKNKVTELENNKKYEHFVKIKSEFEFTSNMFTYKVLIYLYVQYSLNNNLAITDITEFLNSFSFKSLYCVSNGGVSITQNIVNDNTFGNICSAEINTSGITVNYFTTEGEFADIKLENPQILQHIVR